MAAFSRRDPNATSSDDGRSRRFSARRRRFAEPPSAVQKQAKLRRGDRILAAAELTTGAWALVTTRELVVVRDGADPQRATWDAVDAATWSNETEIVTVTWVDGSDTWQLPLAADPESRFTQALRERVQSSVLITEHVILPGKVTARVVLRRSDDGSVLSQVIGDAKLDLNNPEISAIIDATETRLRQHAGLPS